MHFFLINSTINSSGSSRYFQLKCIKFVPMKLLESYIMNVYQYTNDATYWAYKLITRKRVSVANIKIIIYLISLLQTTNSRRARSRAPSSEPAHALAPGRGPEQGLHARAAARGHAAVGAALPGPGRQCPRAALQHSVERAAEPPALGWEPRRLHERTHRECASHASTAGRFAYMLKFLK